VRDERLMPLEFTVRKMTSLPAQRVGLKDRGLLKPGFFADITVFDADPSPTAPHSNSSIRHRWRALRLRERHARARSRQAHRRATGSRLARPGYVGSGVPR